MPRGPERFALALSLHSGSQSYRNLIAAYVIIWTILFLYLFYLHRKQKEVARQLKALSESFDRE